MRMEAMMASVIFEIKHYQISWRQLERRAVGGQTALVRAQIKCTGIEPQTRTEYTLDVVFLAPDSPVPPPSFNASEHKGAMYMPIADIHAFVDMLRNEKPIFGHLYDDKPDWVSVTTTKEPVGSAEINE